MLAHALSLDNLKNLQAFVYETLCNHELLEIGAFEMTQRILVRAGRPCGIFFCLHGPRAVKYTAIWETDRNTVLFYGSSGERFHRVQLSQAPKFSLVADRHTADCSVVANGTPSLPQDEV